MHFFAIDDYRAILLQKIAENKDIRGYQTSLAKEAGCHRSYISQILSERVHLTSEQALRLSLFWKLSPMQTEYFLNLIELNRSSHKNTTEYYRKKIKEIRKQDADLKQRYQQPAPAGNHGEQALYYSTWYYAAVHLTLLNKNIRSVSDLCRVLKISTELMKHILKTLKTLGLVEEINGEWQCLQKSIHLSKQSPLIGLHHMNWRHRAIEDVNKGIEQSIHYSALYSVSKNDAEQLRQMILTFLDKSRKIASTSNDESLNCLNIDFFSVNEE